MSSPDPQIDSDEATDKVPISRAKVLWETLVFQLKLALDGLRDLILSPISIGAALYGIIVGGDRPDQYLRRVMLFGRRSEIWINLFNYRSGGTADQILKPLEEKFFRKINSDSWVGRTNSVINETLDKSPTNSPEKPSDKSDY